MDYIKLKRTLVAAFDHFLSCHDMAELEEMMQALEAGKQLVIGFPEPIHREDYKDDIQMEALPVKKMVSRIKRKNPKPKATLPVKQKHICDIPIFMDLSVLSKEKQKELSDALKTDHHNIVLKNIMIKDHLVLAMASISMAAFLPQQIHKKPLWMGADHEMMQAHKYDKKKNKQQDKIKDSIQISFQNKRKFDPP